MIEPDDITTSCREEGNGEYGWMWKITPGMRAEAERIRDEALEHARQEIARQLNGMLMSDEELQVELERRRAEHAEFLKTPLGVAYLQLFPSATPLVDMLKAEQSGKVAWLEDELREEPRGEAAAG